MFLNGREFIVAKCPIRMCFFTFYNSLESMIISLKSCLNLCCHVIDLCCCLFSQQSLSPDFSRFIAEHAALFYNGHFDINKLQNVCRA